MLQATYNAFSHPSVPTQAVPHGIPQLPWSELYRAAPGAQIPSQLPAGLGAAPQIQFQGPDGVTLVGSLGAGDEGIGPKTLLLLNSVACRWPAALSG